MENRVPHCKECERCQFTDLFYKDYYCCEENEPFTLFERLMTVHQRQVPSSVLREM